MSQIRFRFGFAHIQLLFFLTARKLGTWVETGKDGGWRSTNSWIKAETKLRLAGCKKEINLFNNKPQVSIECGYITREIFEYTE